MHTDMLKSIILKAAAGIHEQLLRAKPYTHQVQETSIIQCPVSCKNADSQAHLLLQQLQESPGSYTKTQAG